MNKRDFKTWLSKFKDSIADYGYYIDFERVFRNVDGIKVELNILNSLIGSKDIESDFEKLLVKYPEILKCIPLLLAVREKEIYAIDSEGECTYSFKQANYSIEQYKVFMRKTGLFDLIGSHIVNNLYDYVTGVETGLDSNGRKNRAGHLMENLVECYIVKAGFVREDTYFKEMTINAIQSKWGIDLSNISNQGKTEKRFDFVVKTDTMIYGIETNFYGSKGSKLNETARSYKNISTEVDTIDGFTFVWFTDGKGWFSAKNNLEETFDVMQHIYSIEDLENNIIGKVFKEPGMLMAKKKEILWEPENFELQMTTHWSFPERGNWATHDAKYRGNWSPFIPRNILLRYSDEGDYVLDQFAGGGTTLVEAKLLNRNILGVDVNDFALERCRIKTDFEREHCGKVVIKKGDARNLNFVRDNSIDLVCTHPPYANIIKYSEDLPDDLSHFNVKDFLEEMKKVASECYRVLKADKFCAILMGDTRQKGHMIPMSFEVMKIFENEGFSLKELIIKEQHNCKATGYWKTNSVKYNFLLIAHECLFVFKKV